VDFTDFMDKYLHGTGRYPIVDELEEEFGGPEIPSPSPATTS